jgi:hypothetical protein
VVWPPSCVGENKARDVLARNWIVETAGASNRGHNWAPLACGEVMRLSLKLPDPKLVLRVDIPLHGAPMRIREKFALFENLCKNTRVINRNLYLYYILSFRINIVLTWLCALTFQLSYMLVDRFGN